MFSIDSLGILSSLLSFVQLRIWDFSGQTTQYFLNEKEKGTKYPQLQMEQDVSF